jgi:hypothetical protein
VPLTSEQLFEFVKQGGAYCAPLLLLALFWLARDRSRILVDNKEKDQQLAALAAQIIEVTTEVKVFLFNERRGKKP